MGNRVINIHQSFWGEVNHGHDLITTSLNNDVLNQTLSSFTDRPGSTYGRNIRPYFSGKKIGDYFVFTKSYPDDTSSRTGMVFTHALIFSTKEITSVKNIDFVFRLFSDKMPVKPSRNELLYFIRQKIKDCSDDSQTMYPKYIQTAVRSLSTGNMPIIFSGEVTNFIQLITQIWKVDFPTLRENISFQIAFTPNDIQQNTSFVFAPNEFLDKWIAYPIINDKEDFLIQIENEVEELLLGNSESNTFLSFLKDLSTTPDSYKTISICHRTYNLYNKLNTCSVSETLQLIRSIATISPQTNESHVKAKAIDRLCFLLPTVSEDEIKGLRNIDFSAFSDGLKKIVSSIDQFLDNQFQSSNPKLEQLSQFLLEVFEKQENVKWWRNAIEDKFISILKIISDFSIIW
ncbi:hypothetical protein EZS27_029874, partial [termite gut metagenome]